MDENKVNEQVEDNIENIPSMDEFKGEIDSSFTKLQEGDILEGTVLTVSENELLVNIGYISDGVIPASEIVYDDSNLSEMYNEGDIIKAKIISLHDGEGNVLLSIKKANEVIVWDELKTYKNEKKSFTVTIKEAVNGGLVCPYKGIRAFMPISKISVSFVEDLKGYVGKEIEVLVIDINQDKNKVILSHKEIEKEELEKKKRKLLSSISKNDRINGVVKKITNFGAFVDIGGIDGLIYTKDLSWVKVKHPSEVVSEGDHVEVYVIDINIEKERIALGLKDVKDNPWSNLEEKYTVGKIYNATVTKLVDFGAFAVLEEGVEGLIHISEISDKRINNPEDVLSVGDEVSVKIIKIDTVKNKLSLSIQQAIEDANKEDLEEFNDDSNISTDMESIFGKFKDMFN